MRLEEDSQQHDFQTLAGLATALWASPSRSKSAAMDTVCAAVLLGLTPERLAERSARALLEQAKQEGMANNTQGNLASGAYQNPFYRLTPEERFLLVALHTGKWSYARLSRILDATSESVQETLWTARIQLAQSSGKAVYPGGASASGPNCPRFVPERPWTQQFLDDEMTDGTEKLFLQNHLMACSPCREALHRAKDLYYAIEGNLPVQGQGELAFELGAAVSQAERWKGASELGFFRTLQVFLGRTDVKWTLGSVLLMIAWKFLRG